MPIDFLGFERQFIDHAAPVWAAMRDHGQFLTTCALADHARSRGIEPTIIDADGLRQGSPPPKAAPGPGPMAFAVSIGDIKVGRRLGYRRFVFMEHGAGQAYAGDQHGARHPSYAGGADREDVELFLVPNEYSAALWRAAYPAAQVEVVGSPRLDGLPRRGPGPGPVVAISFHWPGFVAPEAENALGHFLPVLRELGERFTVIGHAHPKADWPVRMQRVYARAGIPFVADFDDVCRQADVYVCDNSTTLFEFAATGRPVVVLNSPRYRRNIHHGGRFWDWADVGIQVDEPANLVASIDRALFDGIEQQANREAALELVYAYRSGGAERAARAIEAVTLQAVA